MNIVVYVTMVYDGQGIYIYMSSVRETLNKVLF